ncbi:phosphopantetheine-binding protein, partial [Nocardia abscessus]|uniref:phosphopantetheine-binding protein n=1 Tax=Nocardia abscessus TaxID=120957 RepID=UPI002454CCD5
MRGGGDVLGGHDDFFELGGNSLIATQVAARLGASIGGGGAPAPGLDSPAGGRRVVRWAYYAANIPRGGPRRGAELLGLQLRGGQGTTIQLAHRRLRDLLEHG